MVLCNSGEGSGTVEETAVTTIPDQSVVYLNQNFTTGKAGYTGTVRDRQDIPVLYVIGRESRSLGSLQKGCQIGMYRYWCLLFRKSAERMPHRDVQVLVFRKRAERMPNRDVLELVFR